MNKWPSYAHKLCTILSKAEQQFTERAGVFPRCGRGMQTFLCSSYGRAGFVVSKGLDVALIHLFFFFCLYIFWVFVHNNCGLSEMVNSWRIATMCFTSFAWWLSLSDSVRELGTGLYFRGLSFSRLMISWLMASGWFKQGGRTRCPDTNIRTNPPPRKARTWEPPEVVPVWVQKTILSIQPNAWGWWWDLFRDLGWSSFMRACEDWFSFLEVEFH